MIDEIEELWALVDECREWDRVMRKGWDANDTTIRPIGTAGYVPDEFKRLADKLEAMAGRLALRLPT